MPTDPGAYHAAMADFRINVIVDPRRAQAGAARIGQSLTRVGNQADRLRGNIARLFAVLAASVGGIGLVRRIAQFAQAMSTVRAVTAATADQFDILRARARALGSETRFSATQAAEGMLFLARAGFNTGQVLAAIGGTLMLAQAGALGLGEAADIASNVLQGFRLAAEQTGRVVDVLALAANSANTTVGQLGDALKFVAPVAAGLGVSIETTAAAVGALSNAGLQASLAGTGLRRVLAELESPSQMTADIFRSLGVSTDEVRVSQVGLVEVLQRLRRAGVDTGLALEIFGQRGGPAFEVLASSIPSVIALEEGLRNAGGTAQRIAQIMDDNLNGALFRLRSSVEAVVLSFGGLGPESALTVSFNSLAGIFRGLANDARALSIAAGTAGVALAAMVAPFILRGFRTLLGLVAGLSLRVLPLLAAGAAAAFAAIAAIAAAEGRSIRSVFDDLTDQIGSLVGGVVDTFSLATDAVNAFEERIGGVVDTIRGVGGASNLATEQIEGIINTLLELRSDIGLRLDLQNLLFPGSEGARQFEDQLDVVSRALEKFQALLARNAVTDTIFEGGGPVSEEAIRLTAEEAESLRELQDQLDSVGAATREVREAQALLALAVEANAVTAGESARLNSLLGDAYRDQLDPLAAIRRELFESVAVRGFAINQREIEIDLLRAERDLRGAGIRLDEAQRASLRALLVARDRAVRSTRLEQRAYERLQDPLTEYRDSLAAINAVLSFHPELAGRAAQAQEDLRLAFLETQTTFEAGVERGLIRLGQNFRDFASAGEQAVRFAFNSMTDALTEFVTTGKIGFNELINSIISDLARLSIQSQITNPLFDALGGSLGSGSGGGNILGQLFGSLFGSSPSPSIGLVAGRAGGGPIRGPGSGMSDSIPAILPSGSFIVNARAAQRHRQLLDVISRAPRFGLGGAVAARISNGEYYIGPGAAGRFSGLLGAINSSPPAYQAGGFVPAVPGRGSGGSRTVVQVIDQRSTDDPAPQIERRTGPDGTEVITVVVRNATRDLVNNGELDGAMQQRYGLRPSLS